MQEMIYGKNPVREVLRAGRRAAPRLFLAQENSPDPVLQEILSLAKQKKIRCEFVDRSWFDKNFSTALTQGCALEVSAYPYVGEECFQKWGEASAGLVLALDQIQDPQNSGAILRSAEVCGVLGVLSPEKHACPMTPVVAKASAGAIEHLSICRVTNLARALDQLKEKGFWVVGTALEDAENALEFSWPEKTVLVLGSEGQGMRRLVREKCDFLIRLPQLGKIQSLNVSAAATVCLYQNLAFRQKK